MEPDETPAPATIAATDEEFYQRHLTAAQNDLRRIECRRMKKFYERIIARQTKNLEELE